MRENAGKMRTRITPNTDTFYAVHMIKVLLGVNVILVLKAGAALACLLEICLHLHKN